MVFRPEWATAAPSWSPAQMEAMIQLLAEHVGVLAEQDSAGVVVDMSSLLWRRMMGEDCSLRASLAQGLEGVFGKWTRFQKVQGKGMQGKECKGACRLRL
eukprot:jgi/Mesvir1/7379/Mv19180-RA.1